jgi:hypothetical protein
MSNVLPFTKAVPEQAYLKVGWYGSQGSGKTLTSLMVGEWLLEQENKKLPKGKEPYRMAFIDTERGTDFYSIEVKDRKVHPAALEFDRKVTRSVYEVKDILLQMRKDPGPYRVLIIDSMTHIWEAAKESYTGKVNVNGQLPYYAWSSIKRPIKQLMEAGLNGEFHFMFCGREGMVFEKDEESGEESMTGYKMKAETETAYEPHILIQMYQYRNIKSENWVIKAFFEKDRSGALMGKTIAWPTGNVLEPAFDLLSGHQGTFTTADEASSSDARRAYEDKEKADVEADATFGAIRDAILKAKNKVELEAAWNLTKGKKKVLGDRFEALSALTDGRIEEFTQTAIATTRAAAGKESSK